MSELQKIQIQMQDTSFRGADGSIRLKMKREGEDEDKPNLPIPDCEMTLNPIMVGGRTWGLEIKLTIPEDPRIKSVCVFTALAGMGVSFIKHSPPRINVGGWFYDYEKRHGRWDDSSDILEVGSLGPSVNAPLEFEVDGTNEIGMVRGKEDIDNFPSKGQEWKISRIPWDRGYFETTEISEENRFWTHGNVYPTFYGIADPVMASIFEKEGLAYVYLNSDDLIGQVNDYRDDYNAEPVVVHQDMMDATLTHVSAMISQGSCNRSLIGYDIKSEYGKYSDINVKSVTRMTYCESGKADDWSNFIVRAVADWKKSAATNSALINNIFSTVGFAVGETKPDRDGNNEMYLCLDLGFPAYEAGEETEEDREEDSAEEGEEEIEVSLYMDSRNPLCIRTLRFIDWHPIPSTTYYAHGFVVDYSVLNLSDQEKIMEDLSRRPESYPVMLAYAEWKPDGMMSGFITNKLPLDNGFTYSVETTDLQKPETQEVTGWLDEYPVGRFVICGSKGSTFFVINSSSKFFRQVVENGPGIE